MVAPVPVMEWGDDGDGASPNDDGGALRGNDTAHDKGDSEPAPGCFLVEPKHVTVGPRCMAPKSDKTSLPVKTSSFLRFERPEPRYQRSQEVVQ